MKRPYKYTIFCNKTNRVTETNIAPSLHHLQTYEPIEGREGMKELKQTKTCYVDTRYEAKQRLYNYLTYTKQGKEIPKYNPYKGTEIGKSLPILNF